jgi:MGT family glycosyltransferase
VSDFLFVVPPLVGHANPAAGVAAELTTRGHRVAWATEPHFIRWLIGGAATVYPCAVPPVRGGDIGRPPDIRGAEALKYLWEQFLVPLAATMAPGVRDAVEDFRPDVLVADQQALAGGLVAERHGLRWATSATTTAEFTGALAGMPRVVDWCDAMLDRLRERIGVPPGTADPRFSPHLMLAFSTPELAGTIAQGVPGRVHWVGPSIAARPGAPRFPWEWLDPARATVLVTLGTVNTHVGARFLTESVAALCERADRLQAVIVDPADLLGLLPPGDDPGAATAPGTGRDVLVVRGVPQLDLLARVDAVICHAGHNTVCESLWHGVPLVVAPIRDDQPVVAQQVVEAGAGVRVRFTRVTAARLGAGVDAVLDEPGYRAAAERISAAFRAAGGAATAASYLERLAGPVRVGGTRR